MALVAASINLLFNANYTGCHRACWRVQGTVPYDCTTQVNCAGGGLSCPMVISVQVDDASCLPTTFEGYTQACCEDIASANGRLPFTVTYTPAANCLGYTVTCTGPFTVESVAIVSAGSGYPTGPTIAVVFAPAIGGVAADATIGNGGVSPSPGAINYIGLGSGYLNGTYNNVPAINSLPQLGVGVGALFTVVISGGQISDATIVPGSNGSGYVLNDTITFNDINLGGGGGTGILLSLSTLNTGEVEQIIVTNPGGPYTSAPAATLPGGIVNASLVAVLNSCPTIDLTSCGNPALVNIPSVPPNAVFTMCNTSAYVLPVEYSVVVGVCCSDCVTLTINKPATPGNTDAVIYYQDCVTKEIIGTSITAGGIIGPVCAVNNSWIVIEDDSVTGTTTVLVGASC